MKKLTVIPLFALALAGCASFSTTQVDERNKDGTTKVTTTVKARTLWESRSALANFKASQTEKTQGASVGSLNQEASSTNAVRAIEALERIAVGTAK